VGKEGGAPHFRSINRQKRPGLDQQMGPVRLERELKNGERRGSLKAYKKGVGYGRIGTRLNLRGAVAGHRIATEDERWEKGKV